MLVSCICVSHNKPDITHEAIQSIIHQSYPHWEAIVVDSGVLYDAGYYDHFPWRRDQRVKLIRSTETDETRRTKAMAPWCYNECFRRGLVSGDLVMYLCDDDILYPNAFATFVSHCRQNPEALAMYASQDVAVVYPNGWRAIIRMDCHVDYLQFCHKARILDLFPDQEYWPESKDTETHADGIFMEWIGEHTPIYPIDVKVSQNRRTLQSTYVPVRSFTLVECMANGIPFLPSQSDDENHQGPPPAVSERGTGCTMSALEDVPLVTISIAFHNQNACLADALASVAAQTYPNLEVLVLDNCSTDCESVKVFEAMRSRYPRFRFLQQNCAGSDATRDRGLWEAQGVYFIAMDADTLACPEMVERFVAAMRRNPKLSAMTCYFVALKEGPDPLASARNIYSGGIFHTATFRHVGGHGGNLEMPGQEWIGFLRLVNSGHQVDIVPEHLFYYLPLNGSLGTRDDSLRPERALRPFFQIDRQLAAERAGHWAAFADMQRRLEQLAEQNRSLREQNQALEIRCGALRYQVADRLTMLCARVPFAKRSIEWLLRSKRLVGDHDSSGGR
jgi:glycosyltransferase involved in cell wall biosynthesis